MPSLIDATVGGAASNSYATATSADTYFNLRLQSLAWSGEDTDDKERALIMATRRIDYEKFEGEKNTDGQALKWPRIGATDDDGEEFATNAIPGIVIQATYELALAYLTADDNTTDPLANTGLEGFSEATVGPLNVKLRSGFHADELPSNVMRLLRPVIMTPSNWADLLRA